MGLIEIITAGTTGAIIVKALDIIWLQKSLRQTEKIKWLREKRLEAYSELSAEILSLGRKLKTREDPFKGYSLAAKSMILTSDELLASEIDNFFTMIHNMYKHGSMDLRDSTQPLCTESA